MSDRRHRVKHLSVAFRSIGSTGGLAVDSVDVELVPVFLQLVDWGLIEVKEHRLRPRVERRRCWVFTSHGEWLWRMFRGDECKRCDGRGELINRSRASKGGEIHRTTCPKCDGACVS